VLSVAYTIPNGGVTNFFSQIILGLGYTAEQSLLYTAPVGAVQIVSMIGLLYLGDRFRNRIIFSSLGLVIAMVGILMLVTLPLDRKVARLIGYYMNFTGATSWVAVLSLISTNVAGYTKKTTVAALFMIAYCVGNIIGPQTFRTKDAPRYVPGEIGILVCYGVCLLDLCFIYVS
jgi:ACS family allantoate permease-like MFS transporter